MIEPFHIQSLTKPATYLVAAEGPCRYKNEGGAVERFYLSSDAKRRDSELDVRDQVRLAPNSVCFISLEPMFRMPAYIGARFNLLIRDVYRGLLVGTGPLVDPGFRGKLSIPLHNFTNREYFIKAGEGLVYFEFTKIHWKNPELELPLNWLPPAIHTQPPFPISKNKRHGLDDYLDLATGGGPPESSTGVEIAKLKKHSQRAELMLNVYSWGGVIAIVALVYTVWSLYFDALQFVDSAQTELRQMDGDLVNEVFSFSLI